MKTKSLVLILGVVAGGGLLIWAFTRDTVTSSGSVHVPAPSDTQGGGGIFRGIAGIIDAAFGGEGVQGIADFWRSEDDQGVNEESPTAVGLGTGPLRESGIF